jgi:hypothetical protein
MRFHRHPRKRFEVQIIPMIDILLIMLVFFIVTTVFKKPRDILRIELPTVREIPSDKVLAARSVIAVDALGNISLDSLAVPEGLLQAANSNSKPTGNCRSSACSTSGTPSPRPASKSRMCRRASSCRTPSPPHDRPLRHL